MTTLTGDAQQLYDRYLQTVRWSVRGVADADEIERDVREHVETALTDAPAPVTSQTLREVLSRLGDPWQWIPFDELPVWRRLLMRFWLGPEDWRLAYLCFGAMMLGLVLLPVGIGAFILFGSYLLARATCELAADRDGSLGPRRWLVYPPLVFVSLTALVVLFVAPVAPVIAWGAGERGFALIYDHSHFNFADQVQEASFVAACAAVAVGTWWIALSALLAVMPGVVRFIFAPFANRFRRVHALWITAAGAVVGGAGAATLLLH